MSTSPIPVGYHTLTPYLVVDGAAKAIEFYKQAFGAEVVSISPMPDSDRIMNAQLRIGDSMLMLNDEFPEYGSVGPQKLGGSCVSVHIYVVNVDEVFDQAVAAGATPTMPVSDTFWGDRFGALTDPFGHKWSIATHIKDMTIEDYEAGMKEAFEQE